MAAPPRELLPGDRVVLGTVGLVGTVQDNYLDPVMGLMRYLVHWDNGEQGDHLRGSLALVDRPDPGEPPPTVT